MSLDFSKPDTLMRRDGGLFGIYSADYAHGWVKYTIDGARFLVSWAVNGACWHGNNHVSKWDLIPKIETVKPWPQQDDTYFYVHWRGFIVEEVYDHPTARAANKWGNCWRTHEDAQSAADLIRETLARHNCEGRFKL